MPDNTPNPIGNPEAFYNQRFEPARPNGTMASYCSVCAKAISTAMAEVFDRYGRGVYSVALRVLKDAGHAEDVMQDIFFPGLAEF